MKQNLDFKLWLQDNQFIVDEALIPDWLRNVFVGGTIALAPYLMSNSVQAGELDRTTLVQAKNQNEGRVVIKIKIPLEIKRMDLAAEQIKSTVKNELNKVLKKQEEENFQKNQNTYINFNLRVVAELDEEREASSDLLRFTLPEVLPNWKVGDQNKLERLLNVFIKPTSLEKKQKFQEITFKVYFTKTAKKTK